MYPLYEDGVSSFIVYAVMFECKVRNHKLKCWPAPSPALGSKRVYETNNPESHWPHPWLAYIWYIPLWAFGFPTQTAR